MSLNGKDTMAAALQELRSVERRIEAIVGEHLKLASRRDELKMHIAELAAENPPPLRPFIRAEVVEKHRPRNLCRCGRRVEKVGQLCDQCQYYEDYMAVMEEAENG